MEIEIINNNYETKSFNLIKYNKSTIKHYTDYEIILIEKTDKKLIEEFYKQNDDIHINILFDSGKTYRVFNPIIDFTQDNIMIRTTGL